MGIGLDSNLLANAVNNIFKANGKNPASDTRENAIKTTDGVKRKFGDAFVSSRGLKAALNDPDNHLALSIKDSNHPAAAHELADIVAAGLDRADGKEDGWVRTTDRGAWADLMREYGVKRDGYVSADALRSGLESGKLVIGEGGQLLSKAEAKEHGDTVVAIHENKDGPKIALEQ